MQKKLGLEMFLLNVGVFLVFFQFGCENTSSESKKSSLSAAELSFYNGIGVGPVKEYQLPEQPQTELVLQGSAVFKAKCISCHEVSDQRKIGPGLAGITKRRRPEWILNQILNPMEMTQKDSLSKELLAIYMAQMTDMELTEAEAQKVLEYLRMNDLELSR